MFNYVVYQIGKFIALHLPLKLSYKIAVFISDLNYLFAFSDRKAVKENLKVIFPGRSIREICKIRRRMFHNFAKYLVDFFRFPRLDKEYINRYIKIEGIEYFDYALSKNKGVIALTAHLGNWELGGSIIALLGYPLWVVALSHKNKKVDNFFNSYRQSKGLGVIPFGRAARLCLNLLRDNKIVALVGDRDFSEKGIIVDFFGKKTLFPPGPAALALKTQAAIVPGFMIRNSDDTFTLKIEKPIEYSACENIIDTREVINLYKAAIEDYIRKYPEQWYMFRRFWIA